MEMELQKPQHTCTRIDSKVIPRTASGYIMDRKCHCGEIMEKNIEPTTFEGLIRWFIHKKTKGGENVGNYSVDRYNKKIVYTGAGRHAVEGTDTLAIKIPDGRIIGNASKLERCGSYRRGDESPAQRVMFELNVAMIPFNVFEETKLDITQAEVIEQGKEEDPLCPRLKWDNFYKMLMPEEIRVDAYTKDEVMPKSTPDKKIIKRTKLCENIYKKDKNGWNKKDEKGNIILLRKKRYWRYTYIDMKKLVKRHFVGAMLLKVENKHFLFDIDRNEITHYRFNPFLTQLLKPCETIKQAYEMLKPIKVKKALNDGLKVKRQGEWFFIPTNHKPTPPSPEQQKKIDNKPTKDQYDIGEASRYDDDDDVVDIEKYKGEEDYQKMFPQYQKNALERIKAYNEAMKRYNAYCRKVQDYPRGAELKAGNNRPNRVDKMRIEKGVTYVKGEVTHTGREHEPINLTNWHVAVPNTAITSWTISGSID